MKSALKEQTLYFFNLMMLFAACSCYYLLYYAQQWSQLKQVKESEGKIEPTILDSTVDGFDPLEDYLKNKIKSGLQ